MISCRWSKNPFIVPLLLNSYPDTLCSGLPVTLGGQSPLPNLVGKCSYRFANYMARLSVTREGTTPLPNPVGRCSYRAAIEMARLPVTREG